MSNKAAIDRNLAAMRDSFERVDDIKQGEAMAALYLTFWNDYLTIARFAEHIGVSESAAQEIVDAGRETHQNRIYNYGWVVDKQAEYND